MSKIIKVGMADANVCAAPDVITTLGLGSCVGIVLYDPVSKIAGLAHIMLPDSTKILNNSNKYKFADTAIDILIKDMMRIGANRNNLVAKIAGGAQMFNFGNSSEMMRIGDRNVEATKEKLAQLGIRILAEDTGANYGRTIEFYPETGLLHIKAVGRELKII
ncbi:chemotaxis protein CheD [Herbinix hemicellulosilytica]|uniref:Probable chemoreceptor glutamine deamidase CheD n=1 Tax=Herbinix hemicellulosilytica TaxID=1564487 RepID=A0A0H5SW42_HERHM|nr:chemotaxis protein CheD [Herbinix hemicellulosilytica]RBP60843.1 chemotaxis protein CheD [Herbinix hemicellulosilytica]CRZ34538.1 putative chemoreceptor glutamine deamidase CheD [Herbinix hemicellulosilytica]